MRIIWALVVGVVWQVGIACGLGLAAGQPPYSFGVVPQFEQRKLHAIWQPVLEAVAKDTGLTFTLATTLKIKDFEKEYLAEQFDFVYMNPYFIVQGVTPGTYLPLVRDQKPHYGILVVRKDGPIKQIDDLAGKTVAFPSPNSIGATLMIRADLERRFGVKVEPLYVKTHSSVYLHVAKDLAAAGGGVLKTLKEQDAAVQGLLSVLYTTEPVPNLPVAAHRRLPPEIRAKVQRAFLDLGRSEEGRALLAKIPMPDIVPTSLDDYLGITKLGLDRYFDARWSED